MPVPSKVVIECPKCQYTKVVTRGDCLPDASMFQKCAKCDTMMQDSKKSADEVGGLLNAVVDGFKKLLK